jgi:hypothetical protein
MLFGAVPPRSWFARTREPGRSSSSRFSSRASVSQSVGSLLTSSTGTRKNSSRAPLSSTRVSCCVFGRRRSSDGSSPVRRRTSFTATSLKPGFLYQGTPSGGYGTSRHCRSRLPCSTRLRRPTRLAVSSTKTNARPDTEPDRVHKGGGGVVFQHQELPLLGAQVDPKKVRIGTGGEKTGAPGSITAHPPGRR